MLVFIDESGDTGLKIDSGSSRYFIVSLVFFEEDEDALACDQRIQLLKKELGLSPNFEFHFSDNANKLRLKFLETVMPYNFFYVAVAINKNPKKLFGDGFRYKDSFYKYACSLVFENAKLYLKNAKVKVDKSGKTVFRSQLARYLKKKINNENFNFIKHVKMEHSHSNNLLQLADYVCGIVNRKVQQKRDFQIYYKYLAQKELNIQIWPK